MNKSVNNRRISREQRKGQVFFDFYREDAHFLIHSGIVLNRLLRLRLPMLFTLLTRFRNREFMNQRSLKIGTALFEAFSKKDKRELASLEKLLQSRYERKRKQKCSEPTD